MSTKARLASIILAGGQGTRLFPLTEKRCKPAVVFAGKYRLVDVPMSHSLEKSSRISNIFVITQHLANTLHPHLDTSFRKKFPDRRVEWLCSSECPEKVRYKGTADAIRQNLKILLETDAQYFLILSGDQLYQMDYIKMLEYAIEKKASLVIATISVNKEDAKRMGVLKIDEESRVVNFHEKPQTLELLEAFKLDKPPFYEPAYLASMGIYIFSRQTLISLLNEKGDDFGKDLIPIELKKGSTFAYIHEGYWEDIGTIPAYYRANMDMIQGVSGFSISDPKKPILTHIHNLPDPVIQNSKVQNCILNEGVIIRASKVFHSIIGVSTVISEGCDIQDSILMGNHQGGQQVIGKNCTLKNVIVDENASIGENVSLTNPTHVKTYDGDGIYIRDSIIIISEGTFVPSGFIL